MENLPFHPHYDVWALIVSLVIFFELSTKDKTIKKDKRKLWYSGLLILWAFTDYPIHDIGERYLFSVHSAEHLVLALVSPPLLLMGMHREMKKLVSVKPLISVLKITAKPVVAFFLFNFVMVGNALVYSCKSDGNKYIIPFFNTLCDASGLTEYVDSCYWF